MKQRESSLKNIDEVNFTSAEPWNNFISAANTITKPYNQNDLIISLYVHNVVARDDYGSVHMIYDNIVPNDGKANYYMVKTGHLVLNQYKTDRRGAYSFIVNQNTKTIIDFIIQADLEAGKPLKPWLLTLKNGNAIGALSPNKHIDKAFQTTKQEFGKPSITVNTLINSIITHHLSNTKMTAIQKQQLADKMMSNVIVQALVYDRKTTEPSIPIAFKQLKK